MLFTNKHGLIDWEKTIYPDSFSEIVMSYVPPAKDSHMNTYTHETFPMIGGDFDPSLYLSHHTTGKTNLINHFIMAAYENLQYKQSVKEARNYGLRHLYPFYVTD